MNMQKLDELLDELYELAVEDGITQHQCDCVDDDYDAICWFEWLTEVAKKHEIKVKDYTDWDAWEKASELHSIVKEQIKNEIKETIKENENEYEEIAKEVINNIYDEEEHKNGISIDEITKEMHYMVGTLEFEDLISAIEKLCEEENIEIIDKC